MQTKSALRAPGECYAGAPTGFRRLTPSLLAVDRTAAAFDGLPDGVTTCDITFYSEHVACHGKLFLPNGYYWDGVANALVPWTAPPIIARSRNF